MKKLNYLLHTMDIKGPRPQATVTRGELDHWLKQIIEATIADMEDQG